MKLFYAIGAFLALSIFLLGIYIAGGSYNFFIDPASLLLVLMPPLFLSLTVFKPAEVLNSFVLACSKEIANPTQYKKALVFFSSLQSYMILSAIAAFFIGNILMLSGLIHIKDPEVFGSGFAASLISVLYAALLILLVVLPFRSMLQKKLSISE